MADHHHHRGGDDEGEFEGLEVALAHLAPEVAPAPEVKARLMARIHTLSDAAATVPEGFKFVFDTDGGWSPHPVPGIRVKLLGLNRQSRYVTLLFDVEPGARFPPHHHSGAEECYVISGTVTSFGRTIGPGDFLHADADTDHDELYTETGCRVLLVVPADDYVPGLGREAGAQPPSARSEPR